MSERAYIGVGSNLGDRLTHCLAAVRALNRLDSTKVMAISAWYETEPVGDSEEEVARLSAVSGDESPDQSAASSTPSWLLPGVAAGEGPAEQWTHSSWVKGWFLNGVVGLETQLDPRALLDACLAIERERGRDRRTPQGPRTLDLDLLLYGARVINEPGMTVPHRRLAERAFVLIPLSEIAAKTVHPVLNVTIAELRSRLQDRHVVRRYEPGGVSATGTPTS